MTGAKIGVGGGLVEHRHRATKPGLAPQRLPVEQSRRLRRRGEFAPLGAFDIGEKDETVGVGLFAEHHPRVRQSARIDRGERHRLGIVDLRRPRFFEPLREQREGILR